MKAEPTVANAVVGLIIDGTAAAELIVIATENGVLEPVTFVAVTVMLLVPGTVGVPVMAPVDELKVKPVGNTPVSP